MRPIFFITILTISFLGFTSCATSLNESSKSSLSSWIDVYYADVLYQLGQPSYIFSDGLSGRVLVYHNVSQSPILDGLNQYSDSDYSLYYSLVWDSSIQRTVSSRIASYNELLYVDNDGYVYSIQSNKTDREQRIKAENDLITFGLLGTVLLVVAALITN